MLSTSVIAAGEVGLRGIVVVLLAPPVLLFGFLLVLLRPVDKGRGRKWRLPRGPRGWPLIGNLFLYLEGEVAVSGPLHKLRLGHTDDCVGAQDCDIWGDDNNSPGI